MAGARIRCRCGTVFDPSSGATCPACGASNDRKPAGPVLMEPSTFAAKDSGDAVQRDPTTGFGTSDSSFLEKHRGLVVSAGCVGAILVVAILLRLMFGGSDAPKRADKVYDPNIALRNDDSDAPDIPRENPTPNGTPIEPIRPAPKKRSEPVSDIPAFRGTWQMQSARMLPEPVIPGIPATTMTISRIVAAAFLGPDANATLTVDDNGGYVIDVDVMGDGQYTANVTTDRNLLSVAAQGVLTLTPKSGIVSDRARVMLKPVKFDIPQVNARADDTELALPPVMGETSATVTWFRLKDSGQPHTSIVGTWTNERLYVDSYIPYRATLELQHNGDYRVRFMRTEQGKLAASGGDYEFRRPNGLGQPMRGRYAFEGNDRITFTELRGTATWVRVRGGEPAGRGIRR